MKFMKEKDYMKVRRALAGAYREKEKAEVSGLWQERVMHQIRRLSPLKSRVRYFEVFEQFVWRVAPVACVLILILAAVFIYMNFISDYEIAKIFFQDPADFSLLQLASIQ